jgi:peptidoglycan/LPS O-acetylase OafA/YrhL
MSNWYYLFLLAIVLCESWLLGRYIPYFFQANEQDMRAARVHSIDGLRGLLAYSVFCHHTVVFYHHLGKGIFSTTSGSVYDEIGTFYAQMGVLPVTLFFFITAYLFWGKLRRGQLGNPRRFLASRVWRLWPAYLFMLALASLEIAVLTGFRLQQRPRDLIVTLLHWAAFAVIPAVQPINQFDGLVLLSITWTLRLEWLFYLSLPCLGWFARRSYRLVLMMLLFAVIYVPLLRYPHFHLVWLGQPYFFSVLNMFVGGLIVATLPVGSKLREFAKSGPGTVMSLGLLAGTAFLAPPIYSWRESALLLLPFAFCCWGNTWSGLLVSAPVRFLGRISYSLYLLHTLVLAGVLWAAGRVGVFLPRIGPVPYALLMGLCALLLVPLAALCYRWFEAPFLHGAPWSGRKAAGKSAPIADIPRAASRDAEAVALLRP